MKGVDLTSKGKEFFSEDLISALADCRMQSCSPLFMNQIVDYRINSGKDSHIWHKWYSSASIKVTGNSKHGKPMIVYAHVPNCFNNTKNLRKSIKQGIYKGAAHFPQKEFDYLLDNCDNKNIFALPLSKAQKLYQIVRLEDAKKDLQTHYFLGGEERAVNYLEKYRSLFGKKHLLIDYREDIIEDSPLARLLFIGTAEYSGHYSMNKLSAGLGRRARFIGMENH